LGSIPSRFEFGSIPRRFDPTRALATPRSVKALIGPAPRVLADDVWAKLLWAGLHLAAADLGPSPRGGYCYPFELVRALAMTWLYSGLRACAPVPSTPAPAPRAAAPLEPQAPLSSGRSPRA
jgi:hypothetical protein